MENQEQPPVGEPQAEAPKPSEPPWMHKVQMAILLCALAVHPTNWSLALGETTGTGRHVIASLGLPGAGGVNVTLADILLLAGFALYAVRWVLRRRWRDVPPVPVPALLLLGWFLMSAVPFLKFGAARDISELNRGAFAKDFVQLAEFFVVAYILFREGFECPVFRRIAAWVLMAQAGVLVAWAWFQYLDPAVERLLVSGPLATRNSLGTALAMMLPFALGYGLHTRRVLPLALAALIVLAALPVVMSAGALLGICIGLLVVAWLRGRAAFLAVGAALLAAVCVALPAMSSGGVEAAMAYGDAPIPGDPRNNVDILADSLLLYRRGDPYRTLKWTRNQPPGQEAESFYGRGGEWMWRQKFKEWQIAVLMAARSPLFGVGGGSFDASIRPGSYYDNAFVYWSMPKAPEDLMEEEGQNLYLKTAATLGLPALFFLFWLFMQHVQAALSALREPLDDAMAGIAAGAVGAIAGVAFAAVFCETLVRGTGLTLAILLALAGSLKAAGDGGDAPHGRKGQGTT